MARMEKLLVRLDAETRMLLRQLAERQGTSLSDVVRFAIREVAWRRGLSASEGDLFTERARKVLQGSAQEAAQRRHAPIGVEHLSLALLAEREGRAALTLATLGVDLDLAYERVEALIAARPSPTPWQGTGGLADEAKRAIEAATAEANRLGHHYVGTEHLLLGLLAEEGGFAERALERLGVSRAAVRAAVELQKEQLARRFV